MLWEPWLTSIAPILNLTAEQAGVFLGLLFPVVFALCGGMIASGFYQQPAVSMGIPAFLGILIFTYANWLPYFLGAAIAMALALIIAKELS